MDQESHLADAVYTQGPQAPLRHATMRRHHLLTGLIAFSVLPLSALAGSLPGSSQDRRVTFGLGAFGGGHYFAEGTNLGVASGDGASVGARSGAGAGVRAQVGLGRWFVAEAEVLGLATEDRTYQRGARVLGYRVNALATMMPGDFRPFVMVGAGAIQVASTQAVGSSGLVRDTDGEVHVGLGFDYRLVDRLSVRGDARVLEMPSKQSWGLTTDVEATLGAVVSFGGAGHADSSGADDPANSPIVSDPAASDYRAASPLAPVDGQSFDQAAPEPVPESAPHPAVVAMAPLPSARGQAIHEPTVASSSETDLEPEAIPLGAPTVSDLLGRAKEIKFEIGSSRLADSSTPFLDELAAALTREPGVRLEIISHTANNGEAKKDLTLSKRRAETIKSVLVSKGVGTDQLIPIGRGSEEPIAPNITRTGKLRNERVELHRAAAFK